MKKTKLFSSCGKGLIAVFLAAALILPLSRACLAMTAEDAMFMGRLESFVRDQKADGVTTYLNPILGTQAFEGITTGLKDSRAWIRQESAKVLAELGNAGHVTVIMGVAKAETLDVMARDELFLAAYKLKMRTISDLATKQAAILEFLTACADQASCLTAFNGGIPMQALEFLIQEAEDDGMDALNNPLVNLKIGVFKDDPRMISRIDEALANIALRAKYRNISLYTAVLNNQVAFKPWMARSLFKQQDFQTQAYANSILAKLLTGDTGGNISYLLGGIEEQGVLRSENPNACLEYINATSPRTPTNWTVTIAPGAGNAFKFPSAFKPSSYVNCLEVNQPTAGSTTLRQNTVFTFKGRLPRKIELGLSYKLETPSGTYALIGKDGVVYLSGDTTSPPEAYQLKLRASITLSNNTTLTKEVAAENPYSFYNWESLTGTFECSDPNIPVKSVQLEVVASGKMRILCVDDIYCRRAREEILAPGPEITTPITVSPSPAVTYEPVVLTVTVKPLVSGETLSGQWVSSLEGPLGSEVKGSGTLTATVLFTKEGDHELIFTLKDMLGAENLGFAKLKVCAPALVISAAGKEEQAVSAGLALTLNKSQGMQDMPSGLIFTHELVITSAKGTVSKQSVTCPTYPYTYTLDTAKYIDGATEVKAATYMQRSTSGTKYGPFYSNALKFVFENNSPIAVIRIESNDNKNPLTATFTAADSSGAISAYLWNFGDGTTSTVISPKHVFNNTTSAPKQYTVTLKITDNRGRTNSDSIIITVPAGSPPAT